MQQTAAARIDLQSRGRRILESVQTRTAALVTKLRQEAGARLEAWFHPLALGSRRDVERLRLRTARLERRLRQNRPLSSPPDISIVAPARAVCALEGEGLAKAIERALQCLTPEERRILRVRFEVGDERIETPARRGNGRRLEARAVRKLWMSACQDGE